MIVLPFRVEKSTVVLGSCVLIETLGKTSPVLIWAGAEVAVERTSDEGTKGASE